MKFDVKIGDCNNLGDSGASASVDGICRVRGYLPAPCVLSHAVYAIYIYFLVKNKKKRFLCALKSVDRLQTVPCNISSALFAACSLHAFYRKFCIFSAFLLVFRYFRHVLHVFGHVLNVFAFFAMFFSIF